MNIAVDIGYGDTKVAYVNDNGELTSFKFPSAVERIRGRGIDFTKDDEKKINYRGLDYRIGDDVILKPFDTRSMFFLLKYSPLLVYKALKEIEKREGKNIEENNKIAVGLSLLNWDRHKEFMDNLKSFTINDVTFNNEIYLFAQGQGIYFDAEDNIDKKNANVVVDIGFNTLDVIAFENEKPLKDYSYGLNFGAYLMAMELKKLIEKAFNTTIAELEAKEALNNGYFKLAGNIIYFEDEIEDLKLAYSEELIMELINNSKDFIGKADKIIISGGGAYYLNEEELKHQLDFGRTANIIFSNKPFEFANVRGYYKAMNKILKGKK